MFSDFFVSKIKIISVLVCNVSTYRWKVFLFLECSEILCEQ